MYKVLAGELKKKKQWNMKITVIQIFETISKISMKGLEKLEFRSWAETIQTTAFLRSARVLRRVLETSGDLLSDFDERQ